MRIPILSATTRIFAASSTGMTRPSTPSKPASFIRLRSSSVGAAMSALCGLVLKLSEDTGAGTPPRPAAGVWAPIVAAPKPAPTAIAAEAVMNSRRLIDCAMVLSRVASFVSVAF